MSKISINNILEFMNDKEIQEQFLDWANQLKKYQELETRLKNVYGDCDNLLEVVVNHLEKHPEIDIPDNVTKSRLLTDEDVDKWEKYKELDKKGLIIPCELHDILWSITYNRLIECKVSDIIFTRNMKIHIRANSLNGVYSFEFLPEDFGKIVFFTEEEAKKNLEMLYQERI